MTITGIPFKGAGMRNADMNGFEGRTIRKNPKRDRPSKTEKLELLIQKMESLIETGFTGYVKINFSQGSIGRVEKFEEILKELKVKE